MAELIYDSSVCLEAVGYLGLIDQPSLHGLAEHLGIHINTLRIWRRKYPDFEKAVQKGLAIRDRVNSNRNRPEKYNKLMNKKVTKLFAKGHSENSVQVCLGISDITYQKWIKQHPEFKDAVIFGKQLEKKFFEDLGQDAVTGKRKNFDTKLYDILTKNRFGYKQQIELSGDANNPIVTKIEIEFVNSDDDDEDDL